jgi:hypothetical protein
VASSRSPHYAPAGHRPAASGDLSSDGRRGVGCLPQQWLAPIALKTTDGHAVLVALAEEMRRRRIIIPGISVAERMAAEAMHAADKIAVRLICERVGLNMCRMRRALPRTMPRTELGNKGPKFSRAVAIWLPDQR